MGKVMSGSFTPLLPGIDSSYPLSWAGGSVGLQGFMTYVEDTSTELTFLFHISLKGLVVPRCVYPQCPVIGHRFAGTD